MNQMAAMMAQMNKMKRDLRKAMEELEAKEFVVSKAGAVTVTVLGSKVVKSVSIDNDAFDVDNKDMVEDLIVSAINEAMEKIEQEVCDINEKITGSPKGFAQ